MEIFINLHIFAMEFITGQKRAYKLLLQIGAVLALLHLVCAQECAINEGLEPANSCREIKELNPDSPSGYYWIRSSDEPLVYCDMNRTCGGITGGWMRVAKINMTSNSSVCPAGLNRVTSPQRLCGIDLSGRGCSSTKFTTQGV